jgi:MSHA biogenesis protein MshM
VGSGKTMLCRMLLERLPLHVEPIYLANPSLSREEMLYAIADSFALNLEGQRVNIILQTIQNLLEKKLSEGKRVVILVDEAHAMPLDTLEELRLLYNLQVGDQKLLQIVLVGQPELNEKLNQPNMRQLKDRIVHHFTMQPLSRAAIESYLMFRMRTAGFRGSNIFSEKAIALIGNVSQGWLRRVNILADKSLLAAFVEDHNSIEEHHVQEAIRDSDLKQNKLGSKASDLAQKLHNRMVVTVIATAVAIVLILGGVLWLLDMVHFGKTADTHPPALQSAPTPQPAPAATTSPPAATNAQTAEQHPSPPPAAETAAAEPAAQIPSKPDYPLLDQRLDATKALLASQNQKGIGIQLFYTAYVNPPRMERFLERAQKLGQLKQIYVLPVVIRNGKGFRVFYGVYPNIEEANAGMRHLPSSFKKSFAPTLFIFGGTQSAK